MNCRVLEKMDSVNLISIRNISVLVEYVCIEGIRLQSYRFILRKILVWQ